MTTTSNAPQVAINDIGTAEDLLAAIDATIKYFNDGDLVEGVGHATALAAADFDLCHGCPNASGSWAPRPS